MMDAVKTGLLELLSDKLIQQARAYKNLSKELAYFISIKPSTNYSE